MISRAAAHPGESSTPVAARTARARPRPGTFVGRAALAMALAASAVSAAAAADKPKRAVVLSPDDPDENREGDAAGGGEGTAAVAANAGDDADEPLISTSRRRSRKPEPAAESRTSDGDDDDQPAIEPRRRRGGAAGPGGGFFVGLGVGSGAGWAGPAGIEAYHAYVRNYRPGFARQGYGHAVPEIGYFVTPRLALALQGRHQYIPTVDVYTAGGAHLLLARALLFGGEGAGRFYASFAAGGGEGFRLTVRAASKQGTVITDTVRGGPVVAGAGGGFSYAFNGTVLWMVELNTLAGFPFFSIAVDVNTGLRFRL